MKKRITANTVAKAASILGIASVLCMLGAKGVGAIEADTAILLLLLLVNAGTVALAFSQKS